MHTPDGPARRRIVKDGIIAGHQARLLNQWYLRNYSERIIVSQKKAGPTPPERQSERPRDIDPMMQAVIEDPADLTAKLVYADWLQDRDRNDEAEFIRLGVRVDRAVFALEGVVPVGSAVMTREEFGGLVREFVHCYTRVGCQTILGVSDGWWGKPTVSERFVFHPFSSSCRVSFPSLHQFRDGFLSEIVVPFGLFQVVTEHAAGNWNGPILVRFRELFQRYPLTEVRISGIEPWVRRGHTGKDVYGFDYTDNPEILRRETDIASTHWAPWCLAQFCDTTVSTQIAHGWAGWPSEGEASDVLPARRPTTGVTASGSSGSRPWTGCRGSAAYPTWATRFGVPTRTGKTRSRP